MSRHYIPINLLWWNSWEISIGQKIDVQFKQVVAFLLPRHPKGSAPPFLKTEVLKSQGLSSKVMASIAYLLLKIGLIFGLQGADLFL